jgi:arginase
MPRKIAIVVSPFHVGIHRHRVGKGPEAILAKLEPALEERSIPYRIAIINRVDDYDGEIGRSFAVLRQIAAQTRLAVDNDEFPIILAGNCSSSVAVMAGLNGGLLDHNDVDVFWADAHADAHVPDDPGISYFDSMGTSMMTGLCWKGQLDAIEGHIPFPRAVYGWSATPLQWILQYWTPVEWTPVGVGVEWSEPSPTPVLQWTPRLNLG